MHVQNVKRYVQIQGGVSLFNFFSTLIDFIKNIFSFLGTIINSLITSITTLLSAVGFVSTAFGFMPYFVGSSMMIALSFVVINYIIGRDNQ